MARKFRVATAAGTFDHFHKGHEMFLRTVFRLADRVWVGVTSDQFAASSGRIAKITPFTKRLKAVEAFLHKERLLTRAKIFELADIYGPTLEPDCQIEAIVVTEKTLYGANLINTLRGQKKLPPLEILNVSYIKAEDGGDLSSTRIRNGQIDREGGLFIKKQWLEKTLMLPDNLRPMLQKPIGTLIAGREENLNEAVAVIKSKLHPRGENRSTPRGWPKDSPEVVVVTVGDVVAQSFNAGGLSMDIAIVDFHVKREERFKNVTDLGFKKNDPDITVKNPKGTLAGETFQAVQEGFQFITPRMVARQRPRLLRGGRSPFVIRVIGEEDLATLAVVLAAPLGTHVYYGQPRLEHHPYEGIVQVVVTESKKAEIRDIVSQFEN